MSCVVSSLFIDGNTKTLKAAALYNDIVFLPDTTQYMTSLPPGKGPVKVGDTVTLSNKLGSLNVGDKVKILAVEDRPYNEWNFKTGKKVGSGKRKMYKINIPNVGEEWITSNHIKKNEK